MTISTSKKHVVYLDGNKLSGVHDLTLPSGPQKEVCFSQGESTGKTTDITGTLVANVGLGFEELRRTMQDLNDFSMAATKAFSGLYLSLNHFMVATCLSYGHRLPGSTRTKRLRKKRDKAARVWFLGHVAEWTD